jgi:hypothetical protein
LIDADICLHKAWQNFYKQEDEDQKNIDGYDLMRDQFYEQRGFECCQQTIVDAPTVEAVTIRKGAINGDVLCSMFPNMHYTLSEKTSRVVTTIGGVSSFDVDWWNSPYKEYE